MEKKKVRHSLASYKTNKSEYATCDLDELAKLLSNKIFEFPFTERIPLAVCFEIRMLAQAYLHYKQKSERCLKQIKKNEGNGK